MMVVMTMDYTVATRIWNEGARYSSDFEREPPEEQPALAENWPATVEPSEGFVGEDPRPAPAMHRPAVPSDICPTFQFCDERTIWEPVHVGLMILPIASVDRQDHESIFTSSSLPLIVAAAKLNGCNRHR